MNRLPSESPLPTWTILNRYNLPAPIIRSSSPAVLASSTCGDRVSPSLVLRFRLGGVLPSGLLEGGAGKQQQTRNTTRGRKRRGLLVPLVSSALCWGEGGERVERQMTSNARSTISKQGDPVLCWLSWLGSGRLGEDLMVGTNDEHSGAHPEKTITATGSCTHARARKVSKICRSFSVEMGCECVGRKWLCAFSSSS